MPNLWREEEEEEEGEKKRREEEEEEEEEEKKRRKRRRRVRGEGGMSYSLCARCLLSRVPSSKRRFSFFSPPPILTPFLRLLQSTGKERTHKTFFFKRPSSLDNVCCSISFPEEEEEEDVSFPPYQTFWHPSRFGWKRKVGWLVGWLEEEEGGSFSLPVCLAITAGPVTTWRRRRRKLLSIFQNKLSCQQERVQFFFYFSHINPSSCIVYVAIANNWMVRPGVLFSLCQQEKVMRLRLCST